MTHKLTIRLTPEFNFRERLMVLFFGKILLQVKINSENNPGDIETYVAIGTVNASFD